MLVWLAYFAFAAWLLRRTRALHPPEGKVLQAVWLVAWVTTVIGLTWWSISAFFTYQVVAQSSPNERATFTAVGVQELTTELLLWVSPGLASHVVCWALRRRSS